MAGNYRDEIAEEIIGRIEAGTAPWQKPWAAGALGTAPFNPTTGKPYHGINDLWLSLMGRVDPRWMTYRQALEADGQVRKGEKSATIEYWQWTERTALADENGRPVVDEDGNQRYQTVRLQRPRVFYAKVFNGGQIDGLEPWIAPAPSFDPIERAEAIVTGAGVPVFHDQADRAFYRPATNDIHLPSRAAFHDAPAYYETVLHELGHATGHESRLDRAFGPFGSEGYAREELRAEIASFMLARDLGVSFDPGNHAAYVESWLKALREDRNEIFHAARDAETIRTWMLEPEKRPELERAAQLRRSGEQQSIEEPAHPGVEHREQMVQSATSANIANKRDVVLIDRLENYFQPGRKVKGYIGFDRVVEFRRHGQIWPWEVVVQAMNHDGSLGEPRTHCTRPDESELKEWEMENPPPTRARVYLAVPFDERSLARTEGAKWDKEQKSWYITEDMDKAPFQKWFAPPSVRLEQDDRPLGEDAVKTPAQRTYINVPFADKDEAKVLGARWDRKAKSWWVPNDLDPALFVKWAGNAKDPGPAPLLPEKEFAEALKAAGLELEGAPVMDGKWHRVPVAGDRKGQANGSYRAFLDGRPAGLITNYKAGGTIKWVATGVALDSEARARIEKEAAEVKARREAELRAIQEKVAKTAYGVWRNLPGPATPANCPYLAAKGVKGYGVKADVEGHLVVPARDVAGRLWTVQVVRDEGKRFIKDSHKAGTMYVVEASGRGMFDILANQSSREAVVIAEGYATAASIFEATGRPVVVAFDSGNLDAVARSVRTVFPDRPILIAADNDHANNHGNVGMKKAEQAALAVGGTFIAPEFTDAEKARGLTDFNDLAQARGKKAVRQAIETALAPRQELGRGVA